MDDGAGRPSTRELTVDEAVAIITEMASPFWPC
jgi:hypothetical protein